jgi:monoterpene epsilon-lactone hydrolase
VGHVRALVIPDDRQQSFPLPAAQRVSIQAELVRLGARFFIKRSTGPEVSIAERRRRLHAYERWIPSPPAGIETLERVLGGIPAIRVVPPKARPGHHILYLHGGGYVAGSPALYRHLTWRFAAATGASVTAIDYRLAPEHPFPAALDDAVAAWRALLAEGADPRRSTIMGDSAGGGLTLALALRLRDRAEPLPAALVALSPWTDLAITGASCRLNAVADPMQNADDLVPLAARYLAGADPRNPYASPLYGDPRGLPPTLLQVGSDEILRDDAVRMAERMRDTGCEVTLEIWPRMPHVWHGFAPVLPEARQAIARIGAFLRRWTASGSAG